MKRFLRHRRGAVLAEYGLIIGVILIALIGVTVTGGGIVSLYERLVAVVLGA
jgi:Flp pilus assembly pilin Flp